MKITPKAILFLVALALTLFVSDARAQFLWQRAHPNSDWRYSYYFDAVSCYGNYCTTTGLIRDAITDKMYIVFYRSTDGGKTWENQYPDLPYELGNNQNKCNAIQQIDALDVVAVGDTGLILRTFDGGKTWEKQNCNTSAYLNNVHFANPSTGIIVSRDPANNIFTTTDGGRQWTLAPFSSPSLVQCHAYGPGNFIVFDDQQERFYKTHDNWQTVDSTHSLLDAETINRGFYLSYCKFSDGDTILACGNIEQYDTGIIIRSIDGGLTWDKPMLFAGMGIIRFISSLSQDTILAGGLLNEHHILFSSDRGLSWRNDSLAIDSVSDVFDCKGLEAISGGGFVGLYDELIRTRNVNSSVGTSLFINKTTIFPDPATTEVHINLPNGGGMAYIIDMLGREVSEGVLSEEGKLTLDIRSLPSGVYSVLLNHKGNMIPSGKFAVIGAK